MEGKIRLAVFGQKRLSREGGIEIVVKELCTRMAQNGCEVTCYNRAGHHVSGAEYDKTIEYDGIRQKVVPTIEKKGLAAVSSSFFAALCSAFGRYDVVHLIKYRSGVNVIYKSKFEQMEQYGPSEVIKKISERIVKRKTPADGLLKKRNELFEQFQKCYLTNDHVYTDEELSELAKEYDCLICG